jgi:DNA-binding LacI/PurR family transcriptional regulator
MDMFGTQGYCTRLYTGEWTPEYIDTIPEFGEFISDLRRDKIIGAVAITAPGTWMADITSKKIPIVGSAYEYQYGAGHDYCHMVREGVRFLADKKRTKIGFLGWLDPKYPPSKAMADAFRKELHQHGLRYEPAWFRGDMHPCLRGAGWAAFREIWSANEKPDGLLITDSVLYQGAINAVLGLKINVPDELMILTQANTGEDTVYPFPTVRMEYDPHEYAAAIGTLLLKLIKKETVRAPRQYLKFKWVNRNLAETMPCLAERA